MIRTTVDARQILGMFSDLAKEEIPFATATGLTNLAINARLKVIVAIRNTFDRPTQVTVQKSVFYKVANKRKLAEGASVYILDEGRGKSLSPSKWLRAEIFGGQRRDKRLEVALKLKGLMPRNMQTAPSKDAPLDAFGNLRGAFVTQLMSILQLLNKEGYTGDRTAKSKKKRGGKALHYFIVPPKYGYSGIWQRMDAALGYSGESRYAIRPILYFIQPPTYKPRLPFHQLVEQAVQGYSQAGLRIAVLEALARARTKVAR